MRGINVHKELSTVPGTQYMLHEHQPLLVLLELCGTGLTAGGLELIGAVRTLLFAVTLPPLGDAVAVVTGEVGVHTSLLGCGAQRRA